ncbi:hypothetical protein GO988_18480 [Hymenobacter sp. HMF4947]|uniref:Uncharacterized protein n=1 Tax=Hymenobacter ginkgonis TaxID=2682976 RepID=A0A7K1TJF8_9BACT|nr:hypothetical protein [Hymenobacter ginkgonis]MVN78321.1 hypothetical protein [Hymenobacter ginkgonis]
MGKTVGEEAVKLVSSLLLLFSTWAGGYLLLGKWELQKKAREIDLALAMQFQQLFGEFKEIWRLWKVCVPKTDTQLPVPPTLPQAPPAIAWELLARASSAEGRVEAVLLKLATDRTLKASQLLTLGLFRQSFQVLRQGIRDGQSLDYGFRDRKYRLFNQLGAQVAHIIVASNAGAPPKAEQAYQAFQTILDVRSEHLREAEAKLPAYRTSLPLPRGLGAPIGAGPTGVLASGG